MLDLMMWERHKAKRVLWVARNCSGDHESLDLYHEYKFKSRSKLCCHSSSCLVTLQPLPVWYVLYINPHVRCRKITTCPWSDLPSEDFSSITKRIQFSAGCFFFSEFVLPRPHFGAACQNVAKVCKAGCPVVIFTTVKPAFRSARFIHTAVVAPQQFSYMKISPQPQQHPPSLDFSCFIFY